MESISSRRPASNFFYKLIENKWFWIAFVIVAFTIPLYRSLIKEQPTLPPILGQLTDAELLNQDGRKVKLSDFRGSVLVVNFIFTSCPDSCPLLTSQMAKIQNRFVRSAPSIQLLSISVDPNVDTPQVLKTYAEGYKADHKLWSFLTGPFETVEDVVVRGFKVAMGRTEAVEDLSILDVSHGEHFVVVDQLGQIRAYMHARNSKEINQIVRTVALLVNSKPASLAR